MQGVLLHIIADTLGSVGVIVSAFLMTQFGWMIADPLCSMFIALLILVSVYPLLKESVSVLMQRVPHTLDGQLPSCFQRVSALDGVYSVQVSLKTIPLLKLPRRVPYGYSLLGIIINPSSFLFLLIIAVRFLHVPNKTNSTQLYVFKPTKSLRLHFQEKHFWTLCSGVYVGNMKLEVARRADLSQILSHTQAIFKQVGVDKLYVQMEYAAM